MSQTSIKAFDKGIRAYGGLGNAYHSLGEYRKAIECHEKDLQVAQVLGARGREGNVYGNLGVVYFSLGEYGKAIEFYEKDLQIAQEIGNRGGEGGAYGNLGNVYDSLGDHRKAIECYEKHLRIAQEIGNREGVGGVFSNLGRTNENLNDLPQAEQHFRQSIAVFSSIQQALGDSHQWKITILEEQVKTYFGLERVLLKQNKFREALEVSNARRARALYGVLAKRKSLHSEQVDLLMSIDQILKFVTATKSTYLLYSFCAPSEEEKPKLSVYVITAAGEIHYKVLSLEVLPEDSRKVGKIVSRFPFGRTKGAEVTSSTVPIIAEMEECYATKGEDDPIPPGLIKRFKERLKKWYEVFIQPIEQYLPQEKSSPLVIVPDGFLSQLPFAAFQTQKEGKDEYLIEKFSLSTAPSLSVLALLDPPASDAPLPACIFSNPATPDQLKSLTKSQEHVPHLSALLKVPPEAIFMRENATVEVFKKVASKARWVHLSCHGVAGLSQNAHSVFEGQFKFTPDGNHEKGYLYAEEIIQCSLMADLIFLDSCFSGTGKVRREGSIGPIWSFHAAGASSVVGGLWSVPESELVLKMIDTFYEHLLHKGTKVGAFHQAMLLAVEKERENPHLWGTFILSGKR